MSNNILQNDKVLQIAVQLYAGALSTTGHLTDNELLDWAFRTAEELLKEYEKRYEVENEINV